MTDLVKTFGDLVDKQITEHPVAARRMLLAGYYAKRFQLKHFPSAGLSPARNRLAITSMNAVIHPLTKPEKAALVSIFTPCEMLFAVSVQPMLAEAMSSYINGAKAESGFLKVAHEAGLPETFCSYHRVLLGAIFSNVIPRPRFIVNTSLACDANSLTFRKAAEHWDLPQFFVDIPFGEDADAVAYVADQLRAFAPFLEEHSGHKLQEEKLKEHIAIADRTMKHLQRAQAHKAGRFLSNDLTDEMYEVFANHVLLGLPEVETFAEELERDIQQAPPTRGLRLLWMHVIPYYQEDLREMLNFSDRCQIVACDMNFDEFCDMDPEKPYESMAYRLVHNSFNGPSERRIDRALEMCRQLDVDGVVYFCHWGCKQTQGAAQQARQRIEEAGYPILLLDGDGCDTGNMMAGQIRTRMEAFLELLYAKKGIETKKGGDRHA